MIFAELKNNIVQSIRSGNPQKVGISQWVELPNDHQVRPNTTMDFYTDGFQQKPVSQLLKEKLIEPPEGMVWDEEEQNYRVATDRELVEDGRQVLAEDEVLDGDFVRPMTIPERFDTGLIQEDDPEYKEYSKMLVIQRLDDIDREAVRPLRAILAGKDTDYDRQKLTDLEAEAKTLRGELADLGG